MIDFFSKEEEARIISTIEEVENRTSGEVRVHLARDAGKDVLEEAERTFVKLGMDQTRERNGVLFFLVPKAHKFAILGDEGINRRVPDNFWQDVRDLAQIQFRQGNFAEGVCQALERIGEKLAAFFPPRHDDDNELPDAVSYD
jgi:uncharacterized membrane protein